MPIPDKKTAIIFKHLKRCARDMRTVTYGELAEVAGLSPKGVGVHLGYIRDSVCRDGNLPWLNALAVNGKSRRPGYSFLPDGVKVKKKVDGEGLWRGAVLQAFSHDWSGVKAEW